MKINIKNLLSLTFSVMIFHSAYAIEKISTIRPDKGEKITIVEKQKATDEFITLLKDTHYFDFISSRIHGQDEILGSDKFWWANMWTDISATKKDNVVTYTHHRGGSDNIGIHTAPYLEGACFAYMLTGDKKLEYLTRRLMRGFSSWILSSQDSNNNEVNVLSRTVYPTSFRTNINNTELVINYDAARPGIKNGVAEFVHFENNIFGDVWLKNNRSIDDIGHMIRSMAQVQACRPYFSEEAKKDLDQMNALYSAWAKTVVEADFIIPTLISNSNRYIPHKGLGDYNFYNYGLFNPNCTGKYAINLLYDKDAAHFHCGKGISILEKVLGKYLQNDVVEIQRSNHISAIALADLNSLSKESLLLRKGLMNRMDHDYYVSRNPKKYPQLDIQDIPTFFVHANNVGVPLTSEEIRFVYEHLHTAYIEMRSPTYYNLFHLFETSVPDGEYNFDPPNKGLYFYTLGAMIGSCNSDLRNTDSNRTLFDCDRLKEALKNNL